MAVDFRPGMGSGGVELGPGAGFNQQRSRVGSHTNAQCQPTDLRMAAVVDRGLRLCLTHWIRKACRGSTCWSWCAAVAALEAGLQSQTRPMRLSCSTRKHPKGIPPQDPHHQDPYLDLLTHGELGGYLGCCFGPWPALVLAHPQAQRPPPKAQLWGLEPEGQGGLPDAAGPRIVEQELHREGKKEEDAT